jgi:enoyl-CoA hydratase/carnithine racemase
MASGTEVTLSETVLYEKRDGIAWVSLNRPERLNALSPDLRDALARALKDASEDMDIYVVILSGEGGRAFCAGNDLRVVNEAYQSGIAPGTEGRTTVNFSVADCPKPVICAVDGYAVAGGMETSMACDIRIATEQSRFGLPEIKRGRMAGPGLIQLGRMIPLGEAKWIQLTGAHMNAKRAYDIGLIQALLPDRDALFAEAERIANEIKLNAPLSVEATKRIITVAHLLAPEYAQKIWNPERAMIDRSEDIKEGVAAFSEKRDPVWKRR